MPEPLSGAVRFSVDTLLYYAPKIVNTGDELTTAVNKAQRQLTDLGDFFGGSWPDEPFRNSYPRAQWAMIIIARQIAEQIQGIGAGIEDMGRTYQVAEDEITEAARRILPDQARTDARVAQHGGYPRPPVIPDSKGQAATVLSPFAPHPAPSPTSNPAPVPPGVTIGRTSAAVPAPVSSVLTQRPQSSGISPVIEPHPQPGADPTSWAQHDPTSWFGPWPSGDPARMDEAADIWKTLTAALDDAWAAMQRYTAYIVSDCEGKAADLFQDYAGALTGRGHGLLFRAIDFAQELRNACTKQADEIRQLRIMIEQNLIGIVATFVIGQVLSMLTFGSAEEATAAIEAGLTAKLTQAAAFLARIGVASGETLDSIAVATSKAAAAATVSGFQSTLIGGLDLDTTNAIGKAFGQKPTVGAAALQEVAEDGGIGAVLGQGSAGGLLGLTSAAASKRLINLGENLMNGTEENSADGQALIRLGRQLKDGGITMSAANAAATQLVTQHQLTPLTFFSGAVSNRFTTAISPHTGQHTKS